MVVLSKSLRASKWNLIDEEWAAEPQEKKAVFLRFLKVPGINCITTVKTKI